MILYCTSGPVYRLRPSIKERRREGEKERRRELSTKEEKINYIH
jgi:hypothetical protein